MIIIGQLTILKITVLNLSKKTKATKFYRYSKCNGKIYGDGSAAELLGIPPTTLASKMKNLGLIKNMWQVELKYPDSDGHICDRLKVNGSNP
jgi:hypothetical protein